MRIVFTINKLSNFGGSEKVVSVLASKMSKLGNEVYIITQQNDYCVYKLDESVCIKTTRVKQKFKILRIISREIRLRRVLKEISPNVIISFITDMNILTLIASIGLKIPVIVSERANPRKTKLFWKFMRIITYNLAAGFVFQSRRVMNTFSKSIRRKSIVIFNPISKQLPQKEDYSLNYKILNVGRLEKQKNQLFLIREFKVIKEKYPKMKLEIYGSGSLIYKLKEEISNNNLDDSVFLRNPTNDIHTVMKSCDIYVLTSDFEGMPNSLAEALCIGLPCIASKCPSGGVEELITHEYNGFLYEMNSHIDFISCLEILLSNEKTRNKLGENAKKTLDVLSEEVIVNKWLKYLKEIIEGKYVKSNFND